MGSRVVSMYIYNLSQIYKYFLKMLYQFISSTAADDCFHFLHPHQSLVISELLFPQSNECEMRLAIALIWIFPISSCCRDIYYSLNTHAFPRCFPARLQLAGASQLLLASRLWAEVTSVALRAENWKIVHDSLALSYSVATRQWSMGPLVAFFGAEAHCDTTLDLCHYWEENLFCSATETSGLICNFAIM